MKETPGRERFNRRWGIIKAANSAETAEKYAALRALAIKSGDRLSELDFYASEMRARRFWQDQPFSHGSERFWFGLIYDAASDFGRSVWRPIILWLLLLGVGTALHLHAFVTERGIAYSDLSSATCTHGPEDPIQEAVHLSLAHGAILGFGNPERVKISQRCLFGAENSPNGLSSVPKLPVSIAVFSIIHGFMSGIFLFLVGLAMRNNFRAQ